MEDTYQARADFLMAYHGAPAGKCRAEFPEWTKQLLAFQPGSTEEAVWLHAFCTKAFTLPVAPKVEEPPTQLPEQPRLQDITPDPVRAAFEEGWRCSGKYNHGSHTAAFLSGQCGQCLKEYVATLPVQAPFVELGMPGTDLYRRQHAAMVAELLRTCALSANKANSIVSTLLDVAFEASLPNG